MGSSGDEVGPRVEGKESMTARTARTRERIRRSVVEEIVRWW